MLLEKLDGVVSQSNEIIDLSGICLNTLSDSDWLLIQEKIDQLMTQDVKKTTLNLSGCSLSAHDFEILKSILLKPNDISIIVLDNNAGDDINGHPLDLVAVGDLLTTCRAINGISLANNHITNITPLSKCIGQTSLKHLNLRNNQLEGSSCIQVVEMLLMDDCHLESLNLSYNKIDDNGASILIRTLMSEKCKLSNFNLNNNLLHVEGACTLMTCLKTNRHLRQWSIKDNLFSESESQLIVLSSFVTAFRANANSSLQSFEGLDLSGSLKPLGVEDFIAPEGFYGLEEKEKNSIILQWILKTRRDRESAMTSRSDSRQDGFTRSDSRLMQEVSINDSTTFGKHTPRILRKQLMLQLVEHYLGIEKTTNVASSFPPTQCRPSIQRFHGALLFVDISGFTALSLRLSVEELKNHINDYFTLMLEIVDRHGGDVIKFAGDALFIVWQTDYNLPIDHTKTQDHLSLSSYEAVHGHLNDSATPQQQSIFLEACRTAVEQAVECGREISGKCGNHKVILTQKTPVTQEPDAKSPSSSMFRKLMPAMFTGSRPTSPVVENPTSPTQPHHEEENVAYLNVHSGVSCGLMAGIDIGANDRWEYFLMGEPLSRVACAESQAKTGDVIICPESHALLHPKNELVIRHNRRIIKQKSALYVLDSIPEPSNNDKASPTSALLACGCKPVDSGFFCVKQKIISPTTNRKSRVKSKIDDAVTSSEHYSSAGASNHTSLDADLDKSYALFKSICQCELLSKSIATGEATASTIVAKVAKEFGIDPSMLLSAPTALEDEKLKFPFQKWIVSCLTDDLAKHVHHVARNQYVFKEADRTNLALFLEKTVEQRPRISRVVTREKQDSGSRLLEQLFASSGSHSGDATNGPNAASSPIVNGGGVSPTRSRATSHDDEIDYPRRASRTPKLTKRLLDAQESSGLTAELRSVTVMFVKIDMTHMELVIDANITKSTTTTPGSNCCEDFRFLNKTVNEELADQLLLDRLQACMQALTQAFAEKGGQMRQFIVDDKGTVCIGTFGLRGASSDDNAAAAMETAKMIVDNLQELGMNSSVGVTVGKAYCGLVGSNKRHEYAVMGPSTNLSARLMCKAPPCGILCDFETKNRDRTHDFEHQGNIAAKGFSAPVGTFKPIFQALPGGGISLHSKVMSRASFEYYCNDGINAISNAIRHVNNITSGASGIFSQESEGIHTKADNRVIKQILQSKNYLHDANFNTQVSIPDEAGAVRNSIQKRARLHGRRKEIETVLIFLLNALVSHTNPEGISRAPSDSGRLNEKNEKGLTPLAVMHQIGSIGSIKSSESTKPFVFDFSKPARFVGIFGGQGMGKSAVLSAVAQQIFAVVNMDVSNNIHLFKTRFSSFQSATPYSAWTSVVREMLIRIHRMISLKNIAAGTTAGADSKHRRVKRRSVLVGVSTEARDIAGGVDYVMTQLPEDMRKYKPLLGELSITEPNKEAVDALNITNQDKMFIGGEMLLAIITAYPVITGNLVFLSVEDTHHFDLPSKTLLSEIWARGTGVVAVFTGRQAQNTTAALNAVTQDLEKRGYQRPLQHTLNIYDTSEEDNEAAGLSFKGRKGSQAVAPVADFTDSFVDPERYFEVELNPLNRVATYSLVRDILTSFGIAHVTDALLEKLFHVSSGNPMYAKELAKSVVDQNKNTLDEAVVTKAMSAFRSNRLEEVICHRFDKLSSAAQTILKMAAVACSHGGSVTYDTLAFVIDDETKLASQQFEDSQDPQDGLGVSQFVGSSNLNLASVLLNIVNCDHFLCASLTSKAKSSSSLSSEHDDENDEITGGKSRLNVNLEDIANNMYNFRFSVHLEQATIYDLLLDDQKQVIHWCVAEYHQSMRIINAKRSIQHRDSALICRNYADEAYHFVHAAQWCPAMCASYNAAMLEKNEHKKRKHLNTGRSMFLLMKQSCELPSDKPAASSPRAKKIKTAKLPKQPSAGGKENHSQGGSVHGESDKQSVNSNEGDETLMKLSELEHLFQSTFNIATAPLLVVNPSTFQSSSTVTSTHDNSHLLTLDQIFQVFDGDVELLTIGLGLHIQLIQHFVNTLHSDDSHKTQQIIEETLQMLCLTKNPFLFNSAHFNNIISSIANQRLRGDSGAAHNEDSEKVENDISEYFCVKDFYAMCFPVLSAYVINQSTFLMFNSSQKSKLSFLVKHYLHMSLHCDSVNMNNVVVNSTGEAANTSLTVYYIQAINDAVLAAIKDNQTDHAVLYCNELVKIYNYDTHSNDLVLIYGVDRVPQTISMIGQYLLMQGRLNESLEYVNMAHEISLKMSRRSSIVVGIYCICSSLVCLHKYIEAVALFEHYLLIKKTDPARNDVVDEVDNIYIEWLRRLVKFQTYLVTKDGSVFRDDSLEIDDIIQQGCSLLQHTKSTDVGARPYLYDTLCCQGHGMETILLEMCVMKIIVLENNDPSSTLERRTSQIEFASEKTTVEDASMVLVKTFEMAAQSYLHYTMSLSSTNNHQLVLNKICALMSHLQLLHSDNFNAKKMMKDATSLPGGKHFNSTTSLNKIRETASIYKFHLASALLAVYQQQTVFYVAHTRRVPDEAEGAIQSIIDEACEGLSSDFEVREQLKSAAELLIPIKGKKISPRVMQ